MFRRVFCILLLIAVVIFSILALSSSVLAQGHSAEAFERVKEVQELHTERLMALKGVEGTAIGYNQNDRLAIQVFTDGPGVRGIPKELNGVPVQVVVTGKIYALADPTARFERPVPIGVSTGNIGECSAGTIGCRVIDGYGNLYALSNNHVYALENTALDDSEVLQPGRYDADPRCAIFTGDVIGKLYAFEPIEFHPRANNTIDAAIAAVIEDDSIPRVGTATPEGGYGTPSSEHVVATLDMAVQKYGRTTGLTSGNVTGINATVRVRYSSGSARFIGQIIIESAGFSDSGDSGSLIVTQEGNNPVGLLFAGSSTFTAANPIGLVLDRFDVTVDGEEPTPNDPPTVSITSPADGSTFDSGVTISFAGTASDTEDENLTASLVWTSNIDGQIGTGGNFPAVLSDGTHTITASVTDSGGKTASASVSITVGTPPSGDINVDSIVFSCKVAGPNKFLYTTVKVVDGDALPLDGVRVEMTLTHESAGSWDFAGYTGSDGKIKFTLGKAPSGNYLALVTNLTGKTEAFCTLNNDGTIE